MKGFKRVICFILCTLMCISASPFGIGIFAAECAHTYENVTKNGEFAYYGCSKCEEVIDTKPVVFWRSIGGNNSNDGLTADSPVDTIVEAFDRLAVFGMGGTVVLCGQCYTPTSTLADAGGTVTVTSYYNGIDYRETNTACMINTNPMYFNCDVVFDNIAFVAPQNAKAWYLQYNDLTVTDTCKLHQNLGSYTESNPPRPGASTVSYVVNVTTGYKDDAEAVASGKTKEEQTIILNAASFNILSGNKAGYTALMNFCHKKGPDFTRNDQPKVRTNIYIGEGASVGGLDLFPVNNQTTKIYFTDGLPKMIYRQYAGGEFVAYTSIENYDPKTTYVFMDMEDESAPVPEELIHVIDETRFTAYTVQKRVDPIPYPALRVPFTVDPSWIEDEFAPVVEFGALMSLESNRDKIAYRTSVGNAGGTVGKSVAFDQNSNNYLYAGGDAPVTFFGVLEYEKQGYEEKTFTAVPYGVVDSTAIGGKYTLLGESVSFEYGKDELSEYLDALDILTPYDGNKLKIACIGDSITQGTGVSDQVNDSYPGQLQDLLGDNYVVGNFGKASSYVLKADSQFNTDYTAKPHLSYTNTTQYADSLAFEPDVVVIMLGTNDMRHMLSDAAKAEFKETLKELVKIYEVLPSVKKIYLCSNIHVYTSVMAYQLSSGEMSRLVKETAEMAGCEYLDVNGITYDYMNVYMHYTGDRLHPRKEGYAEMAKVIEAGIRGKDVDVTVPALSDTGVVYVRDGGAADGKGATPETAINDIAKAAGLLRESGGTIVVCGPLTIGHNTFMPNTDERITVTSVYNGVDYRTTASAKINMEYNIYLGGDMTFDNVDLHTVNTNLIFVCNYHNVTIGEGFSSTVESTSVKFPVFVVGINAGNEGVPVSAMDFGGECDIVINGGEWQYLRAGNRRQNSGYPIGRILEGASVTVTVNGGTFHDGGSTAPSSATGMNSVYGTCTLVVNGGTFNSDLCGVGRVGTRSSGLTTEMAGTVNLEINGGTITGVIKAVQDTTANVTTGKVNVTCTAAYESKLQGDFASKVIK